MWGMKAKPSQAMSYVDVKLQCEKHIPKAYNPLCSSVCVRIDNCAYFGGHCISELAPCLFYLYLMYAYRLVKVVKCLGKHQFKGTSLLLISEYVEVPVFYLWIDLDCGTSAIVPYDVYCCCPISTTVLMCNSSSLVTSTECV